MPPQSRIVINITMKKVPHKYILVAIFFGSILFNFAARLIFPFDEFIQASIGILNIIILFSFIIYVEYLLHKGKLRRKTTYSYKKRIFIGLEFICIASVLCFLFYLYSKSLEVSLTLWILSFFIILAAVTMGLLVEHRVKMRGGQNTDK